MLISIDSLRADHCGFNGYDKPTTPHLNRLAADPSSVVFTRAYSAAPWTAPSHATMLTGLYPMVHGVVRFSSVLPSRVPTLQAVLSRAGYQTSAVVCAPSLYKRFRLNRGFASYDTSLVYPGKGVSIYSKLADEVTRKGLRQIEKAGDRPFFVFLHYWDVHHPYNPSQKYVDMFDPGYRGTMTGDRIRERKDIVPGMDPKDLAHLIALYDGEIRYVDDAIGRLLSGLAERGLDKDTALIVTSDHGEEFLDHGGKAHLAQGYDEVIRVPLIMKAPWAKRARSRIDDPVSLVDLSPTAMDLLGQEKWSRFTHGRSLYSAMITGQSLPPRALFAETVMGDKSLERVGPSGVWTVSIGSDLMKYHRFVTPLGTEEDLYDLKNDPLEKVNLFEADVPCATAMKQELETDELRFAREASSLQTRKRQSIELSEDYRAKLINLGYLE